MVADRAKIPPWQLDDAPAWWVDRVRLALIAENRAADERRIREERRQRMRARMNGSRGR